MDKAETEEQVTALNRLLNIALQDHGGAVRVANFLLAWYDAKKYGGFDLRDLSGVDQEYAEDMTKVFALFAKLNGGPENLGAEDHFQRIAAIHRN